jgi:hypothetical protein
MEYKDVEKARQVYHDKLVHAWTVALIVSLVIGGLCFPFASFMAIMIALFVLGMGAIILAFATHKEANAYRDAYKEYFIKRNLASVFTNLQYHQNVGLNSGLLRASEMVNTGDIYHSNDLAQGTYKGVNFVQADVHIEEEYYDSDGDRQEVTIFRGRFMVFEFPKKFSFKLELIGKKFGRAYRVPGKDSKTGRKMNKLETESTEFNKAFKIYAQDGFEAFYILDPAIMEKIQAINTSHNGRVLFGFLNNTLLIGLNDGKDSFEPPKSSKPIDEKAEIEKVSKEIRVITDFVDLLSLDKKLFTN